MGSGQGSSSSGKTVETQLSKAQADILKAREEQYQQFFFPEMINALEETKGDTLKTPMMAQQAKSINRSFAQGKLASISSMAQRGLSGSGTEAQVLASANNARSSALADAAYQVAQANTDQRNNILQMGGAMSPTPTTAAPMGQKNSSSSFGIDMGVLK